MLADLPVPSSAALPLFFCRKSLGPARTPGEVGKEEGGREKDKTQGGIRGRKRKLMESCNPIPCARHSSVYSGDEWAII